MVRERGSLRRFAADTALLLAVVGIVPALATSQVDPARVARDEALRLDPYTENDPEAMASMGYKSFGPMEWASTHTSKDIRDMLPALEFRFVETEHFRIVSTMSGFSMPRGKLKKLVRKELEELAKTLPRLKPKRVKAIDPWLHLHLTAARIEAHYTRFVSDLQVDEFEIAKSTSGRYLGMRGKFCVLLFNKDDNLARYMRETCSAEAAAKPAHTHLFPDTDSHVVGIAETFRGKLEGDYLHMQCKVIHNLTDMLVRSYRGYRFSLPMWLTNGMAHFYVHEIEPMNHCYFEMQSGKPDRIFDPKWGKNIRGLVKNKAFRPMSELMVMRTAAESEFFDQMGAWSRIDYALRERPKEFAVFLSSLKRPLAPESGTLPSFNQVIDRQNSALREAFGVGPDEFDEAWCAFVLKNYPKR